MPKRRSDELAAIDEVMPLVDRFNELEHAQKLIFLDMVDPLPEEVAPVKKPQKKSTKKASGKPQRRGMPTTGVINSGLLCAYVTESDKGRERCGAVENDPIHDESFGYAGYHPFQSGKLSSPAPNAAASSSSKKEPHTPSVPARDDQYGVNLEIGEDAVSGAGIQSAGEGPQP